MAKVNLHSAYRSVTGKWNRSDNTVLRQKKYRSETGKIISYGAQEAYEVRNPRDYKKNPPTGAELRNIRSFAEASRLTTLIIQASKYTEDEINAMPEPERQQVLELRAQYNQFRTRFIAQLNRPDPQATILPKTDSQYNPSSIKIQRRRYKTLNTFIRAMILQTIKSE